MKISSLTKILQISIFVILFFTGTSIIATRFGFANGPKTFSVLSGSMEPAISVGSMALVIPQKSYSPYDIIAFDIDGQTVIHRITQTIPLGSKIKFITRGDANNAVDSTLVDQEKTQGKVFLSIPCLGLVKTPKGFALFIVLPALLLVTYEFVSLKKEFEKIITQKAKEMYEKSLAV